MQETKPVHLVSRVVLRVRIRCLVTLAWLHLRKMLNPNVCAQVLRWFFRTVVIKSARVAIIRI